MSASAAPSNDLTHIVIAYRQDTMNKHNTDIRTSSQNILKKFSSRITNEIQWWIAEASQQSTEHYLFNIKSYTKYKNTQRIIEIKKHKSTHKLNNNFHVWKLAGDKN